MPELLNGWRVLESARCRIPSTPRMVLCDDPSGSRTFLVARVTATGAILGVFHLRYSAALADFRERCARHGATTH